MGSTIIIFVTKKIDAPLRGQFELLVDTNDYPTVEHFITFLTKFQSGLWYR